MSHILDMPRYTRFFPFDIPNILLNVLVIAFPLSLSLSKKLGITTTNTLCLVFLKKNLVQQKKISTISPYPWYIRVICRYSSVTFTQFKVL